MAIGNKLIPVVATRRLERPEMVELAKAIHRAVRDFNAREDGRTAKIDSALSRILILDPDWIPRRADPQADQRPAKAPSVFTIKNIAHRLETTVGSLLGERGHELTRADLADLQRIATELARKVSALQATPVGNHPDEAAITAMLVKTHELQSSGHVVKLRDDVSSAEKRRRRRKP